jgi:hypothetical protein
MSMKNFSNKIGNRNRDLPAFSAVPQLTVPLHAENTELKIIFLPRTEEMIPIINAYKSLIRVTWHG